MKTIKFSGLFLAFIMLSACEQSLIELGVSDGGNSNTAASSNPTCDPIWSACGQPYGESGYGNSDSSDTDTNSDTNGDTDGATDTNTDAPGTVGPTGLTGPAGAD